MESIGEKLRNAREEKGYTLEQVARETHIAKRFLNAMEDEDFEVFPGEPYLLGFLRTYTEFLEMDPQEMVALYKNLKLQEQPAPMDELLVTKRSPKPYILTGAIAAGAALIAVALFFLISSGAFSGSGSAADRDESLAAAVSEGETITLSEEVLEQPFQEGDVVSIPVGEEEFPVVITGIGEEVTVTTPAGAQSIAAEDEVVLDLNSDGRGDLRFLVRQIGVGSNQSSAVVRLDRAVQSPNGVVTRQPESGGAEETETETIGSTTEPSREQSARLIVETDSPNAFDIRMSFQGEALLLYERDGGARRQQYFQNGDSFQTSAQESLRLWLTNAGVARTEIAGEAINLGEPGEVTADHIRWVEDDVSGRYRLELIPMY